VDKAYEGLEEEYPEVKVHKPRKSEARPPTNGAGEDLKQNDEHLEDTDRAYDRASKEVFEC
jgi:hypothetical protein